MMGPFEMDRGGWIEGLFGGEEVVSTEAGVTFTAFRVEDPERRPASRRAVAIAGDQRLGSLAHDVATETDPRATGELQPEPGRSGHGARQVAGQAGWLEHHEQRLRAPGQGGEAVEAIGHARRPVRGGETTAGQVQDEQVDRTAGQQRAADGQPFVERLGGDDHQPLEPDAAGDGLDRVEAPRRGRPRPRSRRSPGPPRRAGGRAWSGRSSRRPGARRSPSAAGRRVPGWHRAPRSRSGRSARRGSVVAPASPRVRGGPGPSAGARARAPSVIRGAAAPQRAWRLATAAVTSAERVVIGRPR